MNNTDQKKITKNLIVLQKELRSDVDIITDKLYEQRVFTQEVWQEIRNTKYRLQQSNCSNFINHLLRSGKDSYGKFKTILIDLGHHKLVAAMDNSSYNENTMNWTEDRGKTFVIQDCKHPLKSRKQAWVDVNETEKVAADNRMENISQLERLATFVSAKWDSKDKDHNTDDQENKFQKLLQQESFKDEELTRLFETSRFNKLPLTAESRAN